MPHRDTEPFAYIKSLLAAWGKWAVKSASAGVGWPSVSPMFNDAPRGDGYGPSIPRITFGNRDELERLDAEIRQLPSVQICVLVETYQRGGSMREIAGRMGVKRDAVYLWLEKAHGTLSGKPYKAKA